jgi:FSR family fosmidomycin resistance protein-like MFS transporter
MGWFSLGGNVGFAAAPLLVAAVVATGGLILTPLLVVPALVGSVAGIAALRTVSGARSTTAPAPAAAPGPDDRGSFLRLSGAIVFRSVVFVGLSAFVSLYAQQRVGGGAAVGATALFVLYAGGAVGTVVGGSLANRWTRVAIVRWSYLLTVVAVAGVVLVPGPALFGFVALASAGLYVPFSLQVTLGQDYLPSRVGTASGVTLGLTVSVGGVASPLIGALADASTLQTALTPLIALPVISWLFVRRLTEPSLQATLH